VSATVSDIHLLHETFAKQSGVNLVGSGQNSIISILRGRNTQKNRWATSNNHAKRTPYAT
jgi:hypothetical protein